MKNLIFIFGLLLFFFGCKKKDMTPTYIYGDISSFYANGRLTPREGFDLKIRAVMNIDRCKEPYYGLIVDHTAKFDTLREKISVHELSLNRLGKIPLLYKPIGTFCDSISTARFYMSGGDGDVQIGIYVISKKAESFVNIESYDTKTKEVKGTFDITFVAEGTSVRTRAIYPDTIRFSGAKFSAFIN